MNIVYILQSEKTGRYYHGSTGQSAADRLNDHNAGKVPSTKHQRPWRLAWYAAFDSKRRAEDFERYLKTGSGHAFSRKRLL